MSTKEKSSKTKFLGVVIGLFAVIGLVTGGTYVLNEQGLISIGAVGHEGGERPEAPPSGIEEGGEMPYRPDGDGMALNSQAVGGFFKVVLQMSVVVVIIAGAQRLLSWLQLRRRRATAFHR